MLERTDIERLVPHQGAMCLLERVLRWDEQHIEATSRTHLDVTNPLRSAHGLRSLSLCEYAAQAMALHGALIQETRTPTPGMLATLRHVRIHCEYVHTLPDELHVIAARVHAIEGLVQYEFRVVHADTVLIDGRSTVALG